MQAVVDALAVLLVVVMPHVPARAPFMATFEETRLERRPDGTLLQHHVEGTAYRDHWGRTRTDFPTDGVALLFDPHTLTSVVIDLASGAITDAAQFDASSVQPKPATSTNGRFQPPHLGTPIPTDLGTRQIDGMLCTGRQIVLEDGSTETWHCPDIGPEYPVMLRWKRAEGQFEARLTNVSLVEPPASLFDSLPSHAAKQGRQ